MARNGGFLPLLSSPTTFLGIEIPFSWKGRSPLCAPPSNKLNKTERRRCQICSSSVETIRNNPFLVSLSYKGIMEREKERVKKELKPFPCLFLYFYFLFSLQITDLTAR